MIANACNLELHFWRASELIHPGVDRFAINTGALIESDLPTRRHHFRSASHRGYLLVYVGSLPTRLGPAHPKWSLETCRHRAAAGYSP